MVLRYPRHLLSKIDRIQATISSQQPNAATLLVPKGEWWIEYLDWYRGRLECTTPGKNMVHFLRQDGCAQAFVACETGAMVSMRLMAKQGIQVVAGFGTPEVRFQSLTQHEACLVRDPALRKWLLKRAPRMRFGGSLRRLPPQSFRQRVPQLLARQLIFKMNLLILRRSSPFT